MGSSNQHNINVIWQNTGFGQVDSAMKSFASTSGLVAKSQDAVSGALGKTQGAALKTGQEYTKVGKAATTSSKSTTTLGKAFKSSSLQIAAFASSLTSTYIQIDSLMDQEMQLSKMRATLDKQTATLAIAETNLKKKYDEGKISGEAYRLQSEKLAAQRAILAVKEEQYADAVQDNKTAWIALATTALPTVITGFTSLSSIISSIKTVQTAAKGSTDLLTTSTTGLGTAATTTGTQGITPLITHLKNFLTGSKDTTTALGTKQNGLVGGVSALNLGFTDTEKSGNIFIRTFKNIGTSVKDFFSTIKKDIGSATGIVDKIKAGFTSFFTQIGTGFKGLGGHLKTAGSAFVSFGKQLMGVFVSNPILLIIGAIATALAALIFDLGGFRTKLNEIGVALGQMVPALKPLLDGLGWFGEQLGNIGNFLMGTQKEIEKTAKSIEYLKNSTDPAIIALKKVVDIGDDVVKLEKLAKQFDAIRVAIGAMSDATVRNSTAWQAANQKVKDSIDVVFNSVKEKSPEFIASYNAILKTLALWNDGTLKTKEAQKLLDGQLKVLNSTAGVTVAKEKELIVTQQKAKESSTGLSDAALVIVEAMQQEAGASEETALSLDKNQMAVKNLITELVGALPAAEDMTKEQVNLVNSLTEAAPLLEEYGNKIQYNADKTINWGKTIQEVTKEHEALAQFSSDAWDRIYNAIQTRGITGYKEAISYIRLVTSSSKEEGAVAQKALDDIMAKREESNKSLNEMIDNALKGAEKQTEAEMSVQESLAESAKKIQEKATELKIWDKIQDMSIQNQQNAIKITEEQNKTENTSIYTLQQLATARGLDISMIEKDSAALLQQIQTSKLAAKTTDDLNARIGELVAGRQEDAQASDLETKAQTALLTIMNKVPPVMDMTSKGLAELVKIYDDTANASGIAADEVGKWYAELEKGDAIHDATRDKLIELAEKLKVDVPDAIKNGSLDAFKEFIAGAKGLGDAAEKNADRAAKAFGDLASEAGSVLEDLIKEDLIKGDIDDVIEKLEEAGASIDTLATKQAIIKPILDDKDFTNDIWSLNEIQAQAWAEADLLAKDGGNQVFQSFADGLHSSLGELGPPVVAHVSAIWQQIRATNPGKTGADLIQMLAQELGNPGPITAAAQKAAGGMEPGFKQGMAGLPGMAGTTLDEIAKVLGGQVSTFEDTGEGLAQGLGSGFESGGHYFADAGDKAKYDMMKIWDPAGAELFAKGAEIAGQGASGFESGGQQFATAGQKAMYDLLAPYGPAAQAAYAKSTEIANKTGEGLQTISPQAQTALAPVEGIFSQAFLAASTAAGTQLSTMVTDLQTKMSAMSTSVYTYSNSMKVNFVTNFIEGIKAALPTLDAVLLTTQTSFSTLSTSIATYATSLTTTIAAWITASTTAMGAFASGPVKVVQSALSTLSTSTKTYATLMTTSINSFASSAGTSFSNVASSTKTAQTALSGMSTSVATYMKSMTTNVGNFANKFSSSMKTVGSQADAAANKVAALKKGIDALKSKTITITVNAKGSGLSYIRHGGSAINIPTETGMSYAAGGKTWIQKTPKTLGNTHVAETFPEIISAIPLDPKEKMSPFHDLKMNLPMSEIPTFKGGGGGGGSRQPIQLTLHTTVAMPDGKVLAKAVNTHLFSEFSGVT